MGLLWDYYGIIMGLLWDYMGLYGYTLLVFITLTP
jgi:cell shape-determining protein MreD